MLKINCRSIATIVTAVLLAASVNAAEPVDAEIVADAQSQLDAAETNRNLARQATILAVERAIEAVRHATRLDLDFRINARTSGQTPVETVDGR